jgi:hypothetical protein
LLNFQMKPPNQEMLKVNTEKNYLHMLNLCMLILLSIMEHKTFQNHHEINAFFSATFEAL